MKRAGLPPGSCTGANRIRRARRSAASSRMSPSNPSPTTNHRKRRCWSIGRKLSTASRGSAVHSASRPRFRLRSITEQIHRLKPVPLGHGSFVDRMLEVLRKSPVLQLGGNRKVTLRNVRPPAKTLSLSAEAVVANGNGGKQPSLRADSFGKAQDMASTPAASAQHDRAKN